MSTEVDTIRSYVLMLRGAIAEQFKPDDVAGINARVDELVKPFEEAAAKLKELKGDEKDYRGAAFGLAALWVQIILLEATT